MRAAGREAAAWHDHVDMGVVRHRRSPGVEHGGDADAGAQVARIGGDGHHGLGRRPEQQVIDHGLVLPGEVGDLGRQGEDDMEIADRQKVGLPFGQPGPRSCALALGTMPVATAVVGDAEMAAVVAALDVAAKRCGPAVLDRRDHLQLVQAEMACLGGAVAGPGGAEDVGDLQRGVQQPLSWAPPVRSRAGRACRKD